MKRFFAFLLAVSLFLSLTPVPAQAAETALTYQTITAAPGVDIPENEELFAGYAQQVFYGSGAAPIGMLAGSHLKGDLKVLYNALVPIIRQIASGERSSTVISIGTATQYGGKVYYPDVEAEFSGSTLTNRDLTLLVSALLSDFPYDLYWYDKTSGCSAGFMSAGTLLYVSMEFSVSKNYSSGKFTTNTSKTAAVTTAAANAQRIVSCYKNTSDYNKLMGYSDAICDLTTYNFSAAYQGNFAENNDPWQLIHIFDGNPATKVVCEGYSKAFQYLCDLSVFSGDVSCYSVTGSMNGGPHMWNIVTLKDKNYLVDVTNSDDSDSPGDLLLTGGRGSIDQGYQVGGLFFRYDSETKNLWGTGRSSILTLSSSAYASEQYQNHDHKFGSWKTITSATTSQIGIRSRSCSKCDYLDIQCTDTRTLQAPVVSSVNSDTGKPVLSWESVGDSVFYRIYRSSGSSSGFTRIKSTRSTSFTDTSAKAGVKYYYRVKAVDENTGNTSKYSNIVNRICPLERPSVTITVSSTSGKPIVKWETVKGAKKYYIYRAYSQSGKYTRVGSAISARSFTDTKAEPGSNYYYKVKAIHEDSDANSACSSVVNAVCNLAKPEVSIRLSKGHPRITWRTVQGAEKYYIYRSTSKSSGYSRVKTAISARSFVDTTAEAGVTYYYKIKAIHNNTSANSAYSSVRYITAK